MTLTPGRGFDKPRNHSPLTSGGAKNTRNYFGQRDVRCPLLRPDPTQRPRLEEIRANLHDRIAEAEREGWLGEVEGLQVSLAGAENKLAQIERRRTTTNAAATADLGIPTLPTKPAHKSK